jgi:hypothetical protein
MNLVAIPAILPLAANGSTVASDLPDWIPFGALVAAAGALLGIAVNRLSERRDRRRCLYSDAYQAAVGWGELYYRVRRRDPGRPYEVAARFHQIQEQIDFHQSWIESESVSLGRAYCRLVLRIKALTYTAIKEAWAMPPVTPENGFSVMPVAPQGLEQARERFITDLRDHLTLLRAWRRISLRCRYRDKKWSEIKADIGKDVPKEKRCD